MSFLALAHFNDTTKNLDFIEFILQDGQTDVEINPEVTDITNQLIGLYGNDVDPFAEDFYTSYDVSKLYMINDILYSFDLADINQQAEYNSLINA